jgi:aspartate kinase
VQQANQLASIQIIDEISTRSKDIIIGVGERLSCRIVVAVLKDRVSTLFLFKPFHQLISSQQNVDAELVSLENIVESAADDDETRSADGQRQLGQPFYDRLSKRLGERLNECGDRVPVITGESSSSCAG